MAENRAATVNAEIISPRQLVYCKEAEVVRTGCGERGGLALDVGILPHEEKKGKKLDK